MNLKESGWLEELVKALKNWTEHATTYGSDSDGSKAHGSVAMTLLFENAQHLDGYQRKFGASTISQQHILYFVSTADRFTSVEIKGMGGENDYIAFCEDGFLITDFERWQRKVEQEIEPIDTTGLWKSNNLKRLISIDCDVDRKGIPGDSKKLKRLREYLKRRRHREDIALTLYIDNGQIKTTLPVRSMFKQK